MADLERALDRVAHVPGVLWRRGLMVGHADRATLPALVAKHARTAAAASNANLAVLDAIAAATGASADTREATFLMQAIKLHAGHVRSKTAPYRAETLADAFVTAAALGDLALLRSLFDESFELVSASMDFCELMRVACVNGHRAVVAWLWSLTTDVAVRISKQSLRRVEPIREDLLAGAQRSLGTLVDKHDDDMVTYIQTLLGLDAGRDEPQAVKSDDQIPTATTDEGTLPHDETAPSVETKPRANAAARVFTTDSLMSIIGAFQENPHVVVDPLVEQVAHRNESPPLHAVARLAIIYGDLYAFKAACLLSKVRPPDLPLLLHFAASEGQLDMVRWLHSQFVDGIQCRPDTMAMAVRCGWADVVEWLHSHCPESAQTVSSDAWSDAARWGHLELLRSWHARGHGQPSPDLLVSAVQAGHLGVVQLLHSFDWGYDRNLGRREALKHGHLDIVRWIYTEELVTTGCLIEALRSNTSSAKDIVAYMWSKIDPASDLVVRCVVENFGAICEKAASTTVETMLPMVTSNNEVVSEGLLAATKAVRQDIVRLILEHWRPIDSDQLNSFLLAALETKDIELMTLFLNEDYVESAHSDFLMQRVSAIQTALLDNHVKAMPTNIPFDRSTLSTFKSSIKGFEVDPFVLSAMTQIHEYKEPNESEAGSTSQGSGLEVERALLSSASERARPALVQFLIASNAPRYRDEDVTARVMASDGIIRLVKLGAARDQLTLRCRKHRSKGVLNSLYTAANAARTGNLDVLNFLLEHGVLPDWVLEAVVAVALINSQVNVLEWLRSHETTLANDKGIQLALECDQKEGIGFLVNLRDSDVDVSLRRVLLDNLRLDVERADTTAPHTKKTSRDDNVASCAMSLLQLLMDMRPDQHQRLLETAAESGSLPAVQFILGPRSSFDVYTMLLPDALLATARGNNETIIKTVYERKLVGERIDVDLLREIGGLSGVGAVETLLMLLSEWDPHVKSQLERERASANAFLPSTTTSVKTSCNRAKHRSARSPPRPQRARTMRPVGQV